MKRVVSNKQAFTLIELLVVILIIGILAAVAVPQYQKAVEKSKAVEGMTLVKSVYGAFENYYLAHGEYPTSFSQLDIDVPGTQIASNADKTAGTDVYQVDDDWAIYLRGKDYEGVAAVRMRGPYAGAGFAMWHYYYKYANANIPLRTLVCEEVETPWFSAQPRYDQAALGEGGYCNKLFQGQVKKSGKDSSDTFTLP